jgi:7-keto-8-aminopelargonate synthetase-like enzyme
MVIVEGLYSNHGDVPPLPEIRESCSRHGARLALDDAHGLGTLGASGRGAEEHFGCLGASDILAGTFSKSLCSIGGWIAGDRDVIEYVRYHGRSVLFTAAIAPPMVAAAAAALEILVEQPGRVAQVRGNADLLRRHLREQAVPLSGQHGPLIRIPIGGELACLRLAGELLSRGIFVQPVLHPSVPREEAMIRLCVSAAHDPDELRAAAEQFATVYHALAGQRPQASRASASGS